MNKDMSGRVVINSSGSGLPDDCQTTFNFFYVLPLILWLGFLARDYQVQIQLYRAGMRGGGLLLRVFPPLLLPRVYLAIILPVSKFHPVSRF